MFKRLIKKYKFWKFTKWQKSKIQKEGALFNAFLKTKTIFIHIPKTAGISIIKSVYGDVTLGGHRNMYFYSKIFNFNKEKYFSFCFVRNPFDRLYSSYKFLQKGGLNSHDEKAFSLYMKPYKDFEDFVLNGLDCKIIYEITHLIPQSEFVCDNDGNILVDFVGRFEDLEKDIKNLSSRFGKEIVLSHLNKNTNKPSYLDVYTDEMKEKANKIYKEDLEIFKYTF